MTEIPPHKAAKALSHPIRVAILELVDDQPRSPIEIARALDKPLPRVSYHVRELHNVGALVLTHTEPRRGALAHFYRAAWRVRVEVEPIKP